MASDYISREAAINTQERRCLGCPVNRQLCYKCAVTTTTKQLLELPAADVVDKAEWDKLLVLVEEANKITEAGRWIPVSERLPEEGDVVLCSTWSTVYCGYANSRGSFYVANNTMYDAWTWEPGVTHWRPLPEAPKEVDE